MTAAEPGASAIAAIVPTIGRPQSLERLLDSLARQTRIPNEVVIADGSSGDAIRALAADERWRAAGLRVRHLRVTPPNAVGQRQAAIAATTASQLLLADDDVEFAAGSVEAMLSALESAPDVVAVNARFSNYTFPRPTRPWLAYLALVHGITKGEWQGRVIGPLLRFGYHDVPDGPAPMQWIIGGAALVRRDAFDRAGGFSSFFLHRATTNEDVDLGLKLSRIGRILLAPEALVAHYHDPVGRLSPAVTAEDDLYNRFLILRRTQGLGFLRAFALVLTFTIVETVGNLLGMAVRREGSGLIARTGGRLRALARILGFHGER